MFRLKACLASVGVVVGTLLAAPATRADFLYVTDTGASQTRNVSSGGVVTPFATSGTTAPQGIGVNGTDTTVYVTNNTGNSVSSINVGTGAVTTNFITGLSSPIGVAVDTTGNIYVVNSVAGTVGKYNSAGGTINANFITGLNTPQYVAVDNLGNVYVTASNGLTGTINKWTSAGGTLGSAAFTSTGVGQAEGVKTGYGVNAGFVFVADAADQAVLKVNATTGTVAAFATTPAGTSPQGLAFDTASGNLYVANTSGTGSKLYTSTATGGVMSAFVLSGSTTITTPFDIAQAPEPSSLLLTSLGVGVLGIYRRYSRRKTPVVAQV